MTPRLLDSNIVSEFIRILIYSKVEVLLCYLAVVTSLMISLVTISVMWTVLPNHGNRHGTCVC